MFAFVGRNALHLAAKYGHALCLQKLLQVGMAGHLLLSETLKPE